MLFKIGDLVTRKSYNNDMIFKIIEIKEDEVLLKGLNIRLIADALVSDLVLCKGCEDDFTDEDSIAFARMSDFTSLDRDEYFYLPGKILHIDSDILLSNDLLNPYKIREKAKIQKYINHQKKQKMSKI